MINKKVYYDGTKLLSMNDINGQKPVFYICTSNRSAGKTTYFSRYFINRFIKYGEKFALFYRFNYELDGISDKFFKDINALFFPDYSMGSERKAAGIFQELYLQKQDNEIQSCGYAISLNSADQLKKYSHLFSDTSRILFDEFQSESNHYCNNEIKKFMSVLTTISRGQGKQVRYVPVFMLSNPISLVNPYYTALGISKRLRHDTKFMRGDGWILEQGFNQSAANAANSSGIIKAFHNQTYSNYLTSGIYLNDSDNFIEKMPENGQYTATLLYNGKKYSIKEYLKNGVIYISDSYDDHYPIKLAITTSDHNINYLMLEKNSNMITRYRRLYENGCVRFKNQECKNCFIDFIGWIT